MRLKEIILLVLHFCWLFFSKLSKLNKSKLNQIFSPYSALFEHGSYMFYSAHLVFYIIYKLFPDFNKYDNFNISEAQR